MITLGVAIESLNCAAQGVYLNCQHSKYLRRIEKATAVEHSHVRLHLAAIAFEGQEYYAAYASGMVACNHFHSTLYNPHFASLTSPYLIYINSFYWKLC